MIYTGYAGCEAFDVILYIGRTLTKLNYRVLIIDLSTSEALHKSIKHGMGLDSSEEIINYRDINYTRRIPAREELESFCDGVVFINFGDNYIKDYQFECNSMNIVVNTFPHIIESVKSLFQNVLKKEENISLLIRDIVTVDDVEGVKETILPLKFDRINYLYYDIADYESALNCQITQLIRFTKITARMEKYIEEQIHYMLPNVRNSKIKKAIASAKKGV